MLKTIIGKLERKKKKNLKLERLQSFFFLKLKRLTQNLKAELKKIWIGLDSGAK